MPKRMRLPLKIQIVSKIKTKTTGRNGRQKALSTRSSVGIWVQLPDRNHNQPQQSGTPPPEPRSCRFSSFRIPSVSDLMVLSNLLAVDIDG